MTDELVKRLREPWFTNGCEHYQLEAADRIEALTAENDRLRKALEDIIADCEAVYPPSHGAIKYAAKLALSGETP